MDESPMVIRILRTIENILNTDVLLEDFAIVPCEDNTKNKSPVLYEDHHLGLESWSVKYIYKHVCSEVFKLRPTLAKTKLSYSKMQDLDYLLLGGILINPDVTTFWNIRRQLVVNGIVSVESELNFSRIVLTRKSKSLESFSYRRWLLSRVLEKVRCNNVRPPESLLNNEFNVTQKAAETSQNNYHSWTHRIWCWENLSLFYDTNHLITNEINFSERWIEMHVSEHTGFHYRQYLIELVKKRTFVADTFYPYFTTVTKSLDLINDSDPSHFVQFLLGKKHGKNGVENVSEVLNYLVMLFYDLVVVIDRIDKSLPGHESLWYHRRFVLYRLLEFVHKYNEIEFKTCRNIEKFSTKNCRITQQSDSGLKKPKMFKNQLNSVETSNLYRILIDSERNFVSSNSVDGRCSAVQVDLAQRHTKWLKFVLDIDL